MAGQVHVALSNQIRGVGIVAGGPYYCAQNNVWRAQDSCMETTQAPALEPLLEAVVKNELEGSIASSKNIKSSRVFSFIGKKDEVISKEIASVAMDFYRALDIGTAALKIVDDQPAGHAWPTLDYGNSCPTLRSPPFISRCNYDLVKEMWTHFYGRLEPASEEKKAHLVAFSQGQFFDKEPQAFSVGPTGYAYVPATCQRGEPCRLHFVFHGCKQTLGDIGSVFIEKSGFNRWAESNNTIVVYPQAIRSFASGNPNGCWDWWGYTSPNYHNAKGPQVQMVKKMIDWFSRKTIKIEN